MSWAAREDSARREGTLCGLDVRLQQRGRGWAPRAGEHFPELPAVEIEEKPTSKIDTILHRNPS